MVGLLLVAASTGFGAGYSDTHGDGALTGWTTVGSRTWSESGGYVLPQEATGNSGFLINDFACAADGTFNFTLKVINSYNGKYGGGVFRYIDATHFYYVRLEEGDPAGTNASNAVYLCTNTIGTSGCTTVASNLNYSGLSGVYPLRVVVAGSTFNFYLNGSYIGQVTDATNASGKVGYAYSTQWQGSTYLQFDQSDWTDASTTYTWTGSTNSDWGTSTNWSPNGVPGSGNDIVVNKSGGATIALNGNRNVRNITVGNTGSNSMTIQQGSSGSLTMASGAVISTVAGSTGSHVISCPVVLTSNITATISNVAGRLDIQGAVSGGYTVTKVGSGSMTLSGTNTYTGYTYANLGSLTLSGGHTWSGGANEVVDVNAVGAQNAMLKITAGTHGFYYLRAARATNAIGAVYHSGGALTINGTASGIEEFSIGYGSGASGYYKLSGGTVTTGEANIGGYYGGDGLMDVTGGTFNISGYLIQGRGANSSSLLNITGGTVAPTNTTSLNWATNAGDFSILNIGGGGSAAAFTGQGTATVGTSWNTGKGISLTGTTTASTGGALNLLTNGTATVSEITAYSATPLSVLNFNGGTLKATSTNTGASFLASSNITNVVIHSGGAIIDDNGTNITISRPLLTSAGTGVTGVTVTGQGSGYYGPPLVSITGGTGVPATAHANMVDDGTGNGTYKVGSITVTTPGVYSVAPTTITLSGGGPSSAATATLSTGANTTTGGLTKNGSGTLTLSGANTYPGTTTVNTGTLLLNGQNASATNSIASGAVLELNYAANTILTGTKSFTGLGTLRKTGAGAIQWDAAAATFALSSGSTIDVQEGTLKGGAYGNEVWTNNYSDLNVASGAAFSGVEASVRVDALTGAGTITSGYSSGYSNFTFGVDNGSGDFTGVLGDNDGIHAANFVKAGSGTQTLSGANTFTGTMGVSAGTLKLNNTAALGTTAAGTSVTSGAVLDLNGVNYASAEALTLNGTGITSGGALINSNASGATYGGLVTLGSASSILGGTGTINLSNAGTITGSGHGLTLGGAQGGTLGSILGTGTGTLTKQDAGTWTLSGANTFSGGYTHQAGIVNLQNSSALGSGSATMNGSGQIFLANGINIPNALTISTCAAGIGNGAIMIGSGVNATWSGALNVNSNCTNGATIAGATDQTGLLSLTGPINMGGTATWVQQRDGVVSYSGGGNATRFDLLKGTAKLGATNGLPSGARFSQSHTGFGASLDLNGYNQSFLGIASVTPANPSIGITNSQGTASTLTLTGSTDTLYMGAITGNLSLVKSGTYTQTLGGAGTYTGSTTISAGTLKLGGASVLPSTTALSLAGTLDLNGYNSTIGSLSGNGIVDNTNAAAGTYILTAGGNNGSTTFSGTIKNTAQTVALTKSGSGTLTLSGTNTYSGSTTVSAGTLLVNGVNANSAVTVNGAASMGGTGTVGALSVSSGGILIPGVSGAGTLNTGAFTMSSGSILNVDLGSSSDQVDVTGNLSLAGTVNVTAGTGFGPGTYTLFVFSGSLTSNTLAVGTVPAGYSGQIVAGAGVVNLVLTKSLTVGGTFTANNKAYDGTTSAVINNNSLTLVGVVGADVVTLSPTLVFANASVGAGKTVSLTGSSLGGADAAKYTLDLTGAPTTTASITTKTLTVGGTFTANNKAYDGTTSAVINNNSLTLVGVVGAEVVTLSPTLVFSDAAVGAGKTVSLTGSSLGGADAAKYSLDLTGAPTTTASITSKSLTVGGTFTANNKSYDGTTSAVINNNSLTLVGVVGAEVVTLSPTLVFSDAAVGAGKTVSLTGSSLGGADAAKYTLDLTGAPTSTASITTKTLTVGGTFTANNKAYDGTTSALINNNSLTLVGVVGAEVVTLSPTLVFSDAAVGAGKTVSLTGSSLGGADAAKYTLDLTGAPTTTASITTKALTVGGTFTANNKAYDGTTSAVINNNSLTLTGIVGAEVVTLSPTLVFSDAAVGAGKTVSLTGSSLGGADAAKYTLDLTGAPTTTASITSKSLTVGGTFTANNKSYDGTTSAVINNNSLTLVGVVGAEVVTLSPTLVFSDAAVGAGKTVSLTGSSLGGADAAKYTLDLTGAPTTTASITTKTLTVGGTFTANNKAYDGTTSAVINNNSLTLTGIVGAEVVSLSPTLVFSDAAVGAGKTVSLTGSSLGGADAAKYTLDLTGAPTTNASITTKTLTVGGTFTANNKAYDGTTSAVINNNSLTLVGVVGAEVVTLSPTLVFADALVGAGKTVSLTGSSLGGADAAKYTLDLTGAPTTTASITTKTLTVGGTFTANNKAYDGTTSAVINNNSLTLVGIVGAEVVTLSPTLVFSDAAVGAGKAVSLTGSSLGGADAAKYTLDLTGAPTTTASITTKTLTVGGTFTANNKAYDGTISAVINNNSLTLTGIVGAEVVTLSPTLVFADAAVGAGKAVSLTGSSLGGADAAKYTLDLTGAPTTTASITTKSLTVGGSFTANNKAYDGTTSAVINNNSLTLTGIVGAEVVTLSPTLVFTDAAVGAGKTVSLTGSSLGGADAAKYTLDLTGAPTTTASITTKTLTVGGTFTSDNKAYDGTTSAVINNNSLTLVGIVGAEVVTLSPTLVFSDASVGAGKTVSLTGSSLGGADAAKYTLDLTGAPTATASITSKSLTVGGTFTANNKAYDGTTSAVINNNSLTLVGVVGADVVTLSPTLVFSDAAVGAGKTVSLTGSSLGGADAAKYTLDLTGAPTATASITTKSLTIGGTFTANNKAYDGTTTATINVNSLTLVGVVGAEVVTLSPTLVFSDAAVGAGKVVSLTGSSLGGADAAKYTLDLTGAPTTTASITTKSLTVGGTFTANNKAYDGTTTATINVNSLTLVGVVGAEVVTLSPTLVFADAAVGAGKTVSLTGSSLGGADAAKYTLDLIGAPTTTASITTKSLTIGGTFTANNKAYDGTTSAVINTNSLTLVGVVGAEVVTLSPTLVFSDAAVGAGKTVSLTGSSLGGADAAKYTLDLTGAPTATASITTKALTVGGTFTANNKAYDGTTSAVINNNSLTLVGIEGADVVTLSPMLVFSDAAVGAGKTVSLTGSSLGGADAAKYTLDLTGAPTTTASITTKTLTVGGTFTANNKVYDGTASATVNVNSLTLVGVVGAEVVTLSPTLVFADAAVGVGKTVSLTGSSLGGADAAKYTLDLTGAPTATASITTKSLTIGGTFTANNKAYDGTTNAVINNNSLTLVGIEGADVVTLSPTLVFADAAVGAGKTVSLTGSSLGGADAAKYTLDLTGAPTTTASITTKSLTVGGTFTANNKAYDGTTSAVINNNSLTLVGVVGAEVVTLSPTLVFSDAAVGAGKTVSLTGSSLGGADAAKYTLDLIGAPTTTASITTKSLTVGGTFTANNKAYDGTTSAVINNNSLTLVGVVGAEVVTLSPTLVFADASVGAGKTVSLTGSSLGGADAAKYTLDLTGAPTTTASITSKSLTVGGTFTANNKAYDGTASAVINNNSLTLVGIEGADVVTLSPTLVFSDASVGAGKTVSLTGSTLGGADAAKYTLDLTGAPTTTASITSKSLTIGGTFTANNKAYDGTTSAVINNNSLTLVGIEGADVVTLSPTLVFSDASVGAGKTVSLTGSSLGGADAAKYTLDLTGAPTATASITTKSLTVGGTFTANNKAYDGTTTATINVNSLTLVGVVGAEVVTLSPTLVFADAAVGAGKTVSLTGSSLGGADAAKYTLDLTGAPTATASITTKSLTVGGTFTANNKAYDGTTTATINVNSLTLVGVVGAEVVTLSPTLVFADASVGAGKMVSLTGTSLGGADAAKYTLDLTGAPTTTASITTKSLTIGGTFTANNKAYDGTTSAVINNNSLTLVGIEGADVVTLSPTLVFADASVGAGKTVSLTGSSLGGADAAKYTLDLTGAPTTTASITTKSLTVGGTFTANNKAYDGTASATINVNSLALVGVVGADVVTLSPTLVFADAAVGVGKTVSLTGSSLGGADAAKYTLDLTGAPTTTASITTKSLTVGGTFTANNKAYDGTTSAVINNNSLTLVGVVGAEVVTLSPTLVFADAAVGVGKTVSLTGSSLGGADAAKYTLDMTGAPTATASITSKSLTVGGTFTANSKPYDGTTSATINVNSLSLIGIEGADVVTLSPTLVFADAAVGVGKTVSLTGSSLGGADAAKYTLDLTGAPTTTASITSKSLTVGGTFTANNKAYDGTTSATINVNSLTLVGVVGAEVVTLSPTPVFADAAVGVGKTVSLTGSSLGGADAAKYTLDLTGAPTATASITSKSLTVGGSFTANNKAYDGTASATINVNSLTLVGVVGADVVTLSPTLVFADASVGAGKTVSLTGSSLGGADAAKYTLDLTSAPTATASITSKTLTVGGTFTANNKAYDGMAGATINNNSLTLVGVVGAEVVTLSPTLVFSDASVGAGKTVSLTGSTLGGADAAKYTLDLTGAPTTTASITTKSLTIGGTFTANDKAYDGTTSAVINTNSLTLVGVVGADVVTLSPTLVFSDAAVGAGQTVSLTGSSLGGADAAKYTLDLTGAPTTTASITTKTLTVGGTFTANNKAYDGTTSAVINNNSLTLVGIEGADVVTLSPMLVFSDAAVGAGKTVSLTGSSLGGADAAKYTLDLTGAPTTTASITTKTLTVGGTFTANNKVYDGTASATVNVNSLTLVGVVGAEVVTLSPTLVFADAAVGVGKTVSLTGSSLGGADAAKYTLDLTGSPTTTASITTKSLTVGGTFTANNKAYDGTASATINVNSLALVGVVGADVVTLSPTLVFADAAVGVGKTVSLTGSSLGGADAAKYTLDLTGAPTTTASITTKSLTVGGTFTANDKAYDGTTSAVINTNSLTLVGIEGADVVTLSPTLVFADASVGAGKTVSLTGSSLGGADAAKYTLDLTGAPTTTASITSKSLTIGGTFTANNKAYDGTTSAVINNNSLTLVGIEGADVVTLSPTLVFADAAVGVGKTVSLTGSSLGGADAAKYTLDLTGAPTTTASITTKSLTIGGTFTANNKAYDGTTSAVINNNSLTLVGIEGADVVTLSPTLVFADAAVGVGKTVSLTGSSLGGADAAKYTLDLSGAPTATASITSKSLTVGGSFTANNKAYDGTTSAVINNNSLTLVGIEGADVVTLSPTLVFADASVGAGKMVSLTGSSLGGADAAKYTLDLTGAPTTTASITTKSLTVGGTFTANNKAYDGTTSAVINNNSLTLVGVVGAEVVTLSPTLVFSDASVGAGKTVSLTGSSLGGADAAKYTLDLTGAPTTTASITTKSLTIGGTFTANNKAYDGTTTATINVNSLTLVGVVGAEVVTLSPTLVFSDAAVGAGKTVSLTGSSLGGADAAKYTLDMTGAPTATASITSKTLTIGGTFTANNKAYDGMAGATINNNSLTLVGVVGAEVVTLSPTLVFSDAAVGAGKTVSLTGSSLGGADAAKYTLDLTGAPTTTASITSKSLTIGGTFTANNKAYDGTTSAVINNNSLTLVGIEGADVVTLSPTLVFADAAVGVGKTVSLTGSSLGGADAAKYTLDLTGAPTATASIMSKSLTVGGTFTANNKAYDGTTNAVINNNSLTLVGIEGADVVTLSPTLVFADAAVGVGKTVSLTGSSLGGADAAKYTLDMTGAPTTTASITMSTNDAPTFTDGAAVSVLQNSGAYSAAWASAIIAGPADELAQTVSFTVTNTNNALFNVQPAIAPDGTLTFVPATNATGIATIFVRLFDNGGTADGGVDSSSLHSFTIAVAAVNQAPSFAKGPDQALREDASAQTVAGWATALRAGPAGESAQSLAFAVATDNDAMFGTLPAIDSNGTLTYMPAANAFGVATVAVRLRDNGGTANGGVDSSGVQTFTITVGPVNDAPTFNGGLDLVTLEDGGAQSVSGWATAISSGGVGESGQKLAFVVSHSDSALFAVPPTLSPEGRLEYTPAPDGHGSAIVTVRLKDDGGTADGGIDSSVARSFTIAVLSVNDAPSFVKGRDTTVDANSGRHAIPRWATSLRTGPTDESTQKIGFRVSTDNNALFAAAPSIDADGHLTFASAANIHGEATLSVRMGDDGGTTNGGVDSSAVQTFRIRIRQILLNLVPPVIVSGGGLPDVTDSVNENTEAVTTVRATDADSAAVLRYAIKGGADAAKFRIDSLTGALSFSTAPDFEAPSSADGTNRYVVAVQVSDGVHQVSQTISVGVVDVFEPTDPPFHLVVSPDTLDLLVGDTGRAVVTVRARTGGVLTVDPASVSWTWNPPLGSMNAGRIGATTLGTSILRASLGALSDSVVVVVDGIDSMVPPRRDTVSVRVGAGIKVEVPPRDIPVLVDVQPKSAPLLPGMVVSTQAAQMVSQTDSIPMGLQIPVSASLAPAGRTSRQIEVFQVDAGGLMKRVSPVAVVGDSAKFSTQGPGHYVLAWDTMAPRISMRLSKDSLAAGAATVPVRFSTTDNTPDAATRICWRAAGAADGICRESHRGNTDSGLASLSRSDIPLGAEVWLEARDQAYSVKSVRKDVVVHLDTLRRSEALPEDRYDLLSMPYFDSSKYAGIELERVYGAYDNRRWRVYRTTPEGFVEVKGDDAREGAGSAWWVRTRKARSSPWFSDAWTTATSEPVEVRVAPGWSAVGSPYAFDVDWKTVMDSSKLSAAQISGPYAYSPESQSWSLPDTTRRLRTWHGVMVRNNTDTAVVLRFPSLSWQAVGARAMAFAPRSRRFDLVASQAGFDSARITAGIDSASSDGLDALDHPLPPTPGRQLAMAFPAMSANGQPMDYLTDVRPASDSATRWTFRVGGLRAGVPLVLRRSAAAGSDGTPIWLIDQKSQAVVDWTNSVEFAVGDETERAFTMVVGGMRPAAPSMTRFGIQTGRYAVRWQIPTGMGRTHVRVDLLDLRGRRVRTIVDEAQDPGEYSAYLTNNGLSRMPLVVLLDAGGRRASATYLPLLAK